MFPHIFCLDAGGKAKAKSATTSTSSASRHLRDNLRYMYALCRHVEALSFGALKAMVLAHCSAWFKYAAYDDVKLFVDRCLLELMAADAAADSDPDFTRIIANVSASFTPPSMRATFQGQRAVKQHLLDVLQMPTAFPAVFERLSLRQRRVCCCTEHRARARRSWRVARHCGMNLITVCALSDLRGAHRRRRWLRAERRQHIEVVLMIGSLGLGESAKRRERVLHPVIGALQQDEVLPAMANCDLIASSYPKQLMLEGMAAAFSVSPQGQQDFGFGESGVRRTSVLMDFHCEIRDPLFAV